MYIYEYMYICVYTYTYLYVCWVYDGRDYERFSGSMSFGLTRNIDSSSCGPFARRRGEEFRVLRWSKAGWWWARKHLRRSLQGDQGSKRPCEPQSMSSMAGPCLRMAWGEGGVCFF